MSELIPEIQKTSNLVREITAASVEQNSGSDQINGAIQQLSSVTQQNAAASEEMATASEEMASQADQLKEIISFFKMDENISKRKKAKSKKIAGHPLYESKLNEPKSSGVKLNLSAADKNDKDFEQY